MKKLFLTVAAGYFILPVFNARSASAPGNTCWSIYVDNQNQVWSYVDDNEEFIVNRGTELYAAQRAMSQDMSCMSQQRLLSPVLIMYAIFPSGGRRRGRFVRY